MVLVGHLKGFGHLIVGYDEFGDVGYSITVSIDSGVKNQRGQITAPPQALLDLSQLGGGVLRLEDGTEVDIVHLSTDIVNSVAEIHVIGSLPGF